MTAALLSSDATRGLVLTYSAGSTCSLGSSAYSTLNLICNPNLVGAASNVTAFFVGDSGCQLNFAIETSAACPYVSVRTISPLGTGWIVFISLLVSATLYCTLGAAYKRYYYGSSGVEALPNVDLWRKLYALPARVIRRARGGPDDADDYASMAAHDDEFLTPPGALQPAT